ncbi:MAG: uroporphyrinogen decarboxylase family protein [Candidatus Promineifilaceae bacterium]|nr:uroporphyrinogen decarboxylase family protein [Candidatus Promineifilaceae bacterium]
MNSRQRFNETMSYGNPDRVPFFEEGIRRDVLDTWRKQGMSQGMRLSELVPIDHRLEIFPDLEPYPPLRQWPENSEALGDFRQRMDPHDSRRLPDDWPSLLKEHQNREQPLMLRLHRGLYQTLGVSGWKRFAEVNLLLMDKPKLVREILEIQADFAAQLVERILANVTIDAAVFSEPISGNSGPLISPRMFEDFVVTSYLPLLNILDSYNVHTIIFRTYANARILLPIVVRYGFNCLWACEVDPHAMAYAQIRQEFGRDLRLIGGIDTDVLYKDKDTIRHEVFDKVPPLLASGGFIPLADGRVRAIVPFENYIYYRRQLAQVVGQSFQMP